MCCGCGGILRSRRSLEDYGLVSVAHRCCSPTFVAHSCHCYSAHGVVAGGVAHCVAALASRAGVINTVARGVYVVSSRTSAHEIKCSVCMLWREKHKATFVERCWAKRVAACSVVYFSCLELIAKLLHALKRKHQSLCFVEPLFVSA
jgi:hypothetical protein